MPRPRHIESPKGAVAGAAAGALMGGSPDLLMGGLLGAAASDQAPLSLSEALGAALTARGLQLIRVSRETKFSIVVIFTTGPQQYWSVRAGIVPDFSLTPEHLEDALFDRATGEIDAWRETHGR